MKRDPGAITFGHTLRAAEVSGFILTETMHPPHLVLPRHDHACANLNFVLRGSLRESFGRYVEDCGPYSVIVKPPGESHSNRYGETGAHCLVVEIPAHRLDAARPFAADLFNRPAFHPEGGLTPRFLEIYKELKQPDRASPLVLEGLVLELIGKAARENSSSGTSPHPAWLRRVEEVLHDRSNEPHTLLSLAEEVGFHPSYLARTFRKFHHCSVGDYVRGLRLDGAARELCTTRKALAQVAVDAGYYDQSHFTHAFKARFRMTPGEFRAAVRAGVTGA
ncbi:MAG: helix-turn-helix domain-containing protein [Gemmataceae bacterium]